MLMPQKKDNQIFKQTLKDNISDFEATVVFTEIQEDEVLPDLLQYHQMFKNHFWMSNELKELVSVYDETIGFTPVILTSRNNGIQKAYWKSAIKELDCLKNKGIINSSEIKLDKEKIKDSYIFRVREGRVEVLIVSLHLAENMLRKGFSGIDYVSVPVL